MIAEAPDNFITEDEIDAVIRRGVGEQFTLDQYAYIIQGHDTSEIAAHVKDAYGTGGFSHGISRANDSWVDYSSEGLLLRRGQQR